MKKIIIKIKIEIRKIFIIIVIKFFIKIKTIFDFFFKLKIHEKS